VDQYQAMVNSLIEKSMKFERFLSDANGDRAKTLTNQNMVDNLVQSAKDLLSNSKIAFAEMGMADSKVGMLASQIQTVINKLIYSADIINKLAILVVRKKGRNPLISDELVSMVSSVGKDANNAVALTLVALKSVFAAQSNVMESEAASDLEFVQAAALYKLLTGKDPNDITKHHHDADKMDKSLLQGMLHQAHEDAKSNYTIIHQASKITTTQLNHAQARLNKAQVKLLSLQSGLSAGTSAALAS